MKGGYDMVVVVTDNPIAANMAFNKLDGANAVVCASVEDAKIAKDNEANIIILKNPEDEALPQMFDVITKRPGMLSSIKPRMTKIAPRPAPAAPEPEEKATKHKAAQQEEAQDQNAQEQQGGIRLPQIPQVQMPKMPQLFNRQEDEEEQPKIQTIEKDSYIEGPRRPGLVGWLKDELGIIDDSEQAAAQGSSAQAQKKAKPRGK